MTRLAVIPVIIGVWGAGMCGGLFETSGDAQLTQEADDLWKEGKFPEAAAAIQKNAADHPDSVKVAQGLSYSLVLAGDLAGADQTLAKMETKAKEQSPELFAELKVQRALIALRANQLNEVKSHGEASGHPVGKLLAAEVYLVDVEPVEAKKILKGLENEPGVVGATARDYLALLESPDPSTKTLAEATALWALGSRLDGVEAAKDLVVNLPEERVDKSDLLLIWAGRAVVVGRSEIATQFLDAILVPPPDQGWRVQATRGLIAIADGHDEEGIAIFSGLATGGAPADGLADALATAAGLTKNLATAVTLAGTFQTAPAARALWQAGAENEARASAPAGSLAAFLEQR